MAILQRLKFKQDLSRPRHPQKAELLSRCSDSVAPPCEAAAAAEAEKKDKVRKHSQSCRAAPFHRRPPDAALRVDFGREKGGCVRRRRARSFPPMQEQDSPATFDGRRPAAGNCDGTLFFPCLSSAARDSATLNLSLICP